MSQPCLATSHRRKRHELLSDDNEKSSQQNNTKKKKGGFDVDDIESMDANDYLIRVKLESKGIPDIIVATRSNRSSNNEKVDTQNAQNNYVPIDGSAASVLYLLSRHASLTPPPSLQHLPTTIDANEWTKSIILNFENLRGYLERCKAQGVGGKQTNRIPLPTMKDRASWHIFCVGIDEASGNTDGYYGDEYDDRDGDNEIQKHMKQDKKIEQSSLEKEEQQHPWRINLPTDGYEPKVRLLLQMDQVMIRRVLSHLTHYVHLGWSIRTGRRAEWIYALLARLEKPVHRDDAAVLFSLLKDLTLARSKIDFNRKGVNRKNLAKLNALIALIGVYFEQGGSSNRVMTYK
jgi:survival of motor neuron protein-interacting protein 1